MGRGPGPSSATHARRCVFLLGLWEKTVTDVPAYWMLPASTDKVQPEVGHKIDFSLVAAKKAALDMCISGGRGSSGIQSVTSAGPHLRTWDPSLRLCTYTKLLFFSGIKGYYHYCADPVKPVVVPKSLLHLHDTSKCGSELFVLRQHSEGLKDATAVTEAQTAAWEAQKRQRHRSPVWYTA